MGTDLYHLSKEIMERSHGRLVALLEEIRKRLTMSGGGAWDDLCERIDQELKNATIQ